MLVREYSLKFVKLSKYAFSLESNSRDDMSRFRIGVSEDLEEECLAAMLHDNIDHGRLMVHAQQVEKSHRRKRDRESKKSRSSDQSDWSSGNNSFGVRDRPKFKKGNKHSGNLTHPKNTNAEGDKSDSKECNDRNA